MTDATQEIKELRTQAGRETNGQASAASHARRIDTSVREPQSQDQTIQSMQIELAELRAQVARQTEESKALAVVSSEPLAAMALPVMSIQELKDRDAFIKQVINEFFEEGVHYGVPFPNAKDKDGKPIKMLYKVGAEWFASAFGLRSDYTALESIVDRGDKPFVFYRYRCNLVNVRTGQIMGNAEGNCTSEEEKYKYQQARYKCPSCNKETIIKDNYAKDETKEGWVCYRKNGGCGAKYGKLEASITTQPKPGKQPDPEVVGKSHTIESMAAKRAFVAAVRSTFGLSAYIKYFEGIDDVGDDDNGNGMTVEGTATVKDSVPPRTRKHLETIAQEKATVEPPESGHETVNPPAIDGEHWSLKAEPRANFERAMTNNNITETMIKVAMGAEDKSVSLDALLLGYNSVGAAITAVLTYAKEHAAS